MVQLGCCGGEVWLVRVVVVVGRAVRGVEVGVVAAVLNQHAQPVARTMWGGACAVRRLDMMRTPSLFCSDAVMFDTCMDLQ